MRELIDEPTAHQLMNAIAVTLPVAGLLVGAVWGLSRRRLAVGALRGLAVGCVGIANWLLWRLYNSITDRFGLDTVKNLLINLALFVVIGVAVG
ncbi:MAG: hypothetical protein QHJ73_09795, partial [Armatimonadota bacterium]|nr:hypothetical protein [Armatimonadota bacterium]